MASDILEAWKIHNKQNYLLLDDIPTGSMADRYTPTTRTVAAQFAHVHNVRVHHLKGRAPSHLGTLRSFERGAQPTKAQLKKALKTSEKAVAAMLSEYEAKGKVPSWQTSVTTYMGYFIAHEFHHRGHIMTCLRFGGTKLDKNITYGIWSGWSQKLS
jgi:uncharacterized damage-inducible protein DinB